MAENRLFEATIAREFADTRSFVTPIREIPTAAMRGEGLKELSVLTRSDILELAQNITKMVEAYSKYAGLKGSFKDNYYKFSDFVDNYAKSHICKDGATASEVLGLARLVRAVKTTLTKIDSTISFIQVSYKIDASNDTRWNKASFKSVTLAHINSPYDVSDILDDTNPEWKAIEEIEKSLKSNGTDMFSEDYGKLIIKKLRSFKADVISAVNKYFGKGTQFEEFDIVNLISM